MFSVCSHLGGGSPAGGGRSVQPAGGGQSSRGGGVSGQSSRGGQVSPAGGGGGVRSLQPGGGSVQPAGGVGVSQRGGVSPAGWGGSAGGRGVSILRPLAGGMPLAFTQEDFLVLLYIGVVVSTFPSFVPDIRQTVFKNTVTEYIWTFSSRKVKI